MNRRKIQDEIPNGFVDIRITEFNIKKALSVDSSIENLKNLIKSVIDNRYLKFINIEKGSIIFKANKKFRDKMEDDNKFYEKYTLEFISDVLKMIGIDISYNQLQIISEVYLDETDNKITVAL